MSVAELGDVRPVPCNHAVDALDLGATRSEFHIGKMQHVRGTRLSVGSSAAVQSHVPVLLDARSAGSTGARSKWQKLLL